MHSNQLPSGRFAEGHEEVCWPPGCQAAWREDLQVAANTALVIYNVLNDSLVLLFLLVVLALVLVLVISSPLHFSPLLTYLPSSVIWWPHGG